MKQLQAFILSLLVLVAWSRNSSADPAEFTNNIVIVFDASGSMGGSLAGDIDKMAGAKRALKQVLKSLPVDTHVGITCFGGCARWVYPLGPRDQDKLNAAIDTIYPGGGTPLGDYIKIGADRLLQAREAQHGYGSYQLLVVTDGEADSGDSSLAYATDIVGRGIDFDVIGVAMDASHTLKSKARIYRDARNPEMLERAVTEILAEVTTVNQAGGNPFDIVNAAFGNDDTSREVLHALASTGNYPIGERPPASSRDASAKSAAPQNGSFTSSCSCQTVGTSSSSGVVSVVAFIILFGLLMIRGANATRRERAIPISPKER